MVCRGAAWNTEVTLRIPQIIRMRLGSSANFVKDNDANVNAAQTVLMFLAKIINTL